MKKLTFKFAKIKYRHDRGPKAPVLWRVYLCKAGWYESYLGQIAISSEDYYRNEAHGKLLKQLNEEAFRLLRAELLGEPGSAHTMKIKGENDGG